MVDGGKLIMSLGIDPGTVLRFADDQHLESCYGAQGAPPCRLHENDYVWSRNRIARQTSRDGIITFEQAWSGLHGPSRENKSARYGGLEQSQFSDRVVTEALRQLAPSHTGKVALAVDNSLSEDLQDKILGICSRAHFSNVDLLWRPVAILLDYLDRKPSCRLSAQSRVLVVDAESTQPEATLLGLREIEGMLVPVRHFFQKDQDALESTWSVGAAGIALAEQLVQGKNIPADELLRGAFSADFYRYRDGERVRRTWVKSGAGYAPFSFENKLEGLIAGNRLLDQLINSVLDRPSANEADVVLWNGWPFRARKLAANGTNLVMPADSVARGCRVYAERVECGLPTYREVMPSLEIMYLNPNTNRNEFDRILNGGEYLGGRTIAIEPINRFSLDRDITTLPIVLKRGDWACPKQVEFDGIPPIEEAAPVTITGEMKPGQGKLKLWIASRNNEREDFFGERRKIEINWDTMIDAPEPPQQCPETYPEEGHIFGDNAREVRQILRDYLSDNATTISSRVHFLGAQITFEALLSPVSQPKPGMFGTLHAGDSEVLQLARELGDKIYDLYPGTGKSNKANRHKYLNYMLSFAPDEFVDELRKIYRAGEELISWNTAFAPGRVFSTRNDVTLFFKYLVHESKDDGWPANPDISYTAKYFWSVFRCFCYHEEAAEIDCDLAEAVCKRICNYITYRNRNNWAPVQGETGRWARGNVANSQKFCLCALLFLTRVRRYNCPRFLREGEVLTNRVLELVEAMPRVRFVAMGFNNVNQLVLNFIRNEAEDADYQAVRGLVAEMA